MTTIFQLMISALVTTLVIQGGVTFGMAVIAFLLQVEAKLNPARYLKWFVLIYFAGLAVHSLLLVYRTS